LSKYQILIQNQEKISRLYKEYPLISYLDNTAEKRTTIILKEIEKLVKANNLILVNIKPQDIRLIAECIIEMKIEGQVKNILQFIYKLENFLYPLRIKELVLAPSNMKEDNLECNLIIQEKPI